MTGRILASWLLALVFSFSGITPGHAEGMLDGLSFSGMIGPVENPDLEDTLYFDDGHFWSDICTRCGFVPGPYAVEETPQGVRFTGTLESASRGRFDYDGLVTDDGAIRVSVNWERRRWYWTSRREIAFIGERSSQGEPVSLPEMRRAMLSMDPDGNPMCGRF